MNTRIVGIGASAGGISALESLLSELPPSIDLAIVVVQHLSPDYASSMSSILQRSTELKVVDLKDNTLPLPGHVYIKPPDRDVRVGGSLLRLVPRHSNEQGLHLPIDDFFFSLADSHRQQAIGIVLSGMGTDGSRGLSEIKERGGIVMVQQPSTAQFDGMPYAAIRRRLVDVVLPPAKLASRLVAIVRQEDTDGSAPVHYGQLDKNELISKVMDRVLKVTGIDFKLYRQSTLLRRIEKRMLITQQEDTEAYLSYALDHEEELQILRQSFLIGVTRFFRDQEAFTLFKDTVIPQLFETTGGRDVRLWIPSCSTGEEVYSYAFLLEDYRNEHKLKQSYKIFCSDVDRRAVAIASRGVYDEGIMADVPGDMIQRHFRRTARGFEVHKGIKERILFAVQNLLEDPPFIRVDFISCRNFLIYVNTDIQQRVLSNFHFALNPSGFLMLGPSESLGSLQSAFHVVNRRWKLYRKQAGGRNRNGSPVTPSIGRIRPEGTRLTTLSEVEQVEQTKDQHIVSPLVSSSKMDYFSRYLAERYAPATLFVNKKYDILYLNGDFTGVLRLPRFDARLSLQTVVDDSLKSILTAGVDSVLATGKSGIFERIKVSDGAGTTDRLMKVRLNKHDFYELTESVAILEFYPGHSDQEDTAADNEEVFSVDRHLQEKIRTLEVELGQAEAQAQKLLNELEATNEELQASNRELLASNEEMQSTNEELQSVNEELYTVNNEFQRKNDELNEINNDVSNLLKSTQISTLFVDNQLRIRRFTPGVVQQFDLHASDIGRPITSFANPFRDANLEQLCRLVMQSRARHDQEAVDESGNRYLLRLLPYLTDQDRSQGIVITFMDINDLVESRRRYTDLAMKYRAIFDNAQGTIAVVRGNSRIDEINQPIAGRDIDDVVGTYFTDLIATDQEKVRFNEILRLSFDRREVTTMMGSLLTTDTAKNYITIEVIPISITGTDEEERPQVDRAVIIVHDITEVEQQRQKNERIVEQYREQLNKLQQAAGLFDLKGRFVVINHPVDGLEVEVEEFLNQNITDFLTTEGHRRFQRAVEKIRQGSELERVTYPLSELTQDNHARTVLYRPVLAEGELVFISFEVQQFTK